MSLEYKILFDHIDFYKTLIKSLTKMFWKLFYTNKQVTLHCRYFFTS